MLKKFVLMALLGLLSSCAESTQKTPKILYHCSYRNVSTKKLYISGSRDRFKALRLAEEACHKDPVGWRCYFDSCVSHIR